MANSLRSLLRSLTQTRSYSAPTSSIPQSKLKYVPTSGTYPQGFTVSGTHVGVKASNTSKPDIAFIASDPPANAAAVFTTNKFQAAPVQVSRSVLEETGGSGINSIIINSGCANAVTGNGGLEDARSMSLTASQCFKSSSPTSLVMSTGVIGQRLPIRKILDGIPDAHAALADSHNGWLSTAKAIMTTDTFPKLLSTTFTLPSHPSTTYSLAGMTKGAGMIHPNMATLLGILCTDCSIMPTTLTTLLKSAMRTSFNAISIDGDTSTNDTVALLANSAATPPSTPPISDSNSEDAKSFLSTLTTFSQSLAQLVVRDGEGATKFISLTVRNAPSYEDAHAIANSIARSPLFKTAMYGRDANWGRILCAIGYTPSLTVGAVVPEKTSVSFVPAESSGSKEEGELRLLVDGEPMKVDEGRAGRLLEDEDLNVVVDLGGDGKGEATVWTCDFSHEYVTINGDYRT